LIDLIFQFGSDVVMVRIKDNNIFFRTSQFARFGDIDGIKLKKVGVLKEFPDLKDKEDWQSIARTRFKDKIKQMKTERQRADYVIDDLKKYGYQPMYEQIKGFRTKKLK